LSDNKISNIDEKSFDDLEELEYLYLDNNELKSICFNLFRANTKLKLAKMNGNNFSEIRDCQKRETLNGVNDEVVTKYENSGFDKNNEATKQTMSTYENVAPILMTQGRIIYVLLYLVTDLSAALAIVLYYIKKNKIIVHCVN
jgi:hypothetical protein